MHISRRSLAPLALLAVALSAIAPSYCTKVSLVASKKGGSARRSLKLRTVGTTALALANPSAAMYHGYGATLNPSADNMHMHLAARSIGPHIIESLMRNERDQSHGESHGQTIDGEISPSAAARLVPMQRSSTPVMS